ncbi:MAG: fatty acid desaturase [Burkholderiales bacterium]|nr:fatty acid desaturase [Burkholderiales bacterium]
MLARNLLPSSLASVWRNSLNMEGNATRLRGPAAPAHRAVSEDIGKMWRYARAAGFARELKALHRPRPLLSLAAAAADWLFVAAAAASVAAFGWIAVPLALLVIGNRQRALGNLLHDASHRSFDANRPRARVLANLLCCWPLWVSMRVYRAEHNRHHKFLGDPGRDPDFIHDETRLARGWVSVWLDQVLSPRMLRGGLFGHLGRMSARGLAGVACWWAGLLGAIGLVASPREALGFAALWIAARAFVFHPITAFREISDHVGLEPGGLIAFSRNHPFSSLAGQLFHPHRNGYHLLHHLTPRMPFHALPKAHALLMRWPRYAAGEHCDSYFSAGASAVRSWVRHATRRAAAG